MEDSLINLIHVLKILSMRFKTNNIKGVQKMIRQNRMIIQQMDNEATVDIETENLKCYVILETLWCCCKTSGAGGGDCGIAIIDNH